MCRVEFTKLVLCCAPKSVVQRSICGWIGRSVTGCGVWGGTLDHALIDLQPNAVGRLSRGGPEFEVPPSPIGWDFVRRLDADLEHVQAGAHRDLLSSKSAVAFPELFGVPVRLQADQLGQNRLTRA